MAGLRRYETHPKIDLAVLERHGVFNRDQIGPFGFESGGIAILLFYHLVAETISLFFDYEKGVRLQEIKIGYANRKTGRERYFICPDSGVRCQELHLRDDHFVARKLHPRINSKKPPPAHRQMARLIEMRDRVLGLNGYSKAVGRAWEKMLLELVAEPFLISRFPELKNDVDRFHRMVKRERRGVARRSLSPNRYRFGHALLHGRLDERPIDLSMHLSRSPTEWLETLPEPRDRFGNSPIGFLEDQASIDLRKLARTWRFDDSGIWALRTLWQDVSALLIVDFREPDKPLLALREILLRDGQTPDDLIIKLVPSAFKGRWFMECPLSGKRCEVLYWRDDVFASAQSLRYVHRSQRLNKLTG